MKLPSLFDNLTMGSVRPLEEVESDFMVDILNSEILKPIYVDAEGLRKNIVQTGDPPPQVEILVEKLYLTSGLTFSLHTVAFWAVLARRPAESVLWAWTIVEETRRKGNVFTLRDWADKSPYGTPDEDHLRSLWTMQKGPKFPHGNWLDTVEAWAQ